MVYELYTPGYRKSLSLVYNKTFLYFSQLNPVTLRLSVEYEFFILRRDYCSKVTRTDPASICSIFCPQGRPERGQCALGPDSLIETKNNINITDAVQII